MTTLHARLGPSASARWMTCTASVRFVEELRFGGKVPEDESSPWAAEGTVAHQIRAESLELGLDPHDFVGQFLHADGHTFQVTEEMAEYLLPGIDWVREQSDELHIETRVDLSSWLPGQFGTIDAGWLNTTSILTLGVSDLKFGMMWVGAEANPQQMIYLLGLWDHLGRPEVERCLINIDQPRAFGNSEIPEELRNVVQYNDEDEDISETGMKFWSLSFDDLLKFGERLRHVYNDIMTGQTKFAPSVKACTYCPARDANAKSGYLGCPAYNQWMMDIMLGAIDFRNPYGPEMPDPVTFDAAKRYQIVRNSKAFIKWLGQLYGASMDAALAGNPDPGSKAVIGRRGHRFYKDEEAAKRVMVGAVGRAAFKPRTLIGITEAEKLLKPGRKKQGHPKAWVALQELLDQPAGKPVLVAVDDERQAIMPDDDEFDDLPEEGIVSDDDFEDM
jgi:hypothetical protein